MAERVKKALLEEEIASAKRDYDIFQGFINVLQNPDRILKETAEGLAKGYELYEEMEDKDAHIYSVLQKRRLSVLRFDWTVLPASDSEKDRDVAEFVKKALKPHVRKLLEDLWDAIPKGFSVVEVIYKVNEKVEIAEIKKRAQRRFVFDPDGRLRLKTPEAPLEGIELPERKFVVMTFGSNQNPYGKGVLMRCFWPWWFKKHAVLFWSTFLEKFAQPTPLGHYPPGTPERQRQNFLEALEALQSEYAIIIPEGFKVELLEAKRSGSLETYEAFLAYMDRQISKAVLSSTLAVEEARYGTRAQAEIHKEVADEIVEADAKLLMETINSTIVKWLVDFNFNVKEYPEFVINYEDSEAGKEAAERDKILITEIGLPVSLDYLYEKYKIPKPGTDQDVIAMAVTQKKEAETSQVKEFAEEEDEWDEFIRKEGEYIEEFLKANFDEIYGSYEIDQIEKAFEKSKTFRQLLDRLNNYEPKKLARVWEKLLLWANSLGLLQAEEQIVKKREFSSIEYLMSKLDPKEAIAYIKRKIPVDPQTWRQLTEEARNAAFYVAKIEKLVVVNAIKERLLKALEEGKTFSQVKGELFDILTRGGYSRVNPYHLYTTFYTNIYSALNAQHYNKLQRVKKQLPYWQYKAVLDSRTRPTHAAMHNYVAPADDPIWDVWFPPNGFNCRCRVIAISRKEYERIEKKPFTGVQPDEGFRNNVAKMRVDVLKETLKRHEKYKEYLDSAIETWLGLRRPAPEEIPLEELPEMPKKIETGKSFEYYWKTIEDYLGQKGDALYLNLSEDVATALGLGAVKIDKESLNHIVGRPDREPFLLAALEGLKEPFEIWEIRRSGGEPKYRFISLMREGNKLIPMLIIVELKEGKLWAFNKTSIKELINRRKGRFLYGK